MNYHIDTLMTTSMADPAEDFDVLHWKIIEMLRDGRVTPSFVAEETGESRQLISSRLRDLTMAGYVDRVHTGLYELVQDPQDRDDA